jgi:hypothetical protein
MLSALIFSSGLHRTAFVFCNLHPQASLFEVAQGGLGIFGKDGVLFCGFYEQPMEFPQLKHL